MLSSRGAIYQDDMRTASFAPLLTGGISDEVELTPCQNTVDYYTRELTLADAKEHMEPYKEVTCFYVDGILTDTECSALIQFAEMAGFQDLAGYRKGYRDNQRVSIYDLEAAEILMTRIEWLLPKEIQIGRITWEVSHMFPLFRFGKYNPNDKFVAHKDAGVQHTNDRRPVLTVMWYLNAVEDADQPDVPCGRTRMLTLNKSCKKSDDKCEVLDAVEPRAGRCVIFSQGCIYHDGETVKNCVKPKYIMRTDIMYRRKEDEAASKHDETEDRLQSLVMSQIPNDEN